MQSRDLDLVLPLSRIYPVTIDTSASVLDTGEPIKPWIGSIITKYPGFTMNLDTDVSRRNPLYTLIESIQTYYPGFELNQNKLYANSIYNVYCIQCTLLTIFSISCTLYSVQCTLYTIHYLCNLHTVQ